MLLVLLRAVVAAREREDQGIVALQLAEPSWDALVIGQLVVRERAARAMSSRIRDPPWVRGAQREPRPPGMPDRSARQHGITSARATAAADEYIKEPTVWWFPDEVAHLEALEERVSHWRKRR